MVRKKEYQKEMKKISQLTGVEITPEVIKEGLNDAIKDLLNQGLPPEVIKNIFKSARPMGDFGWFSDRLKFDEFNTFFGGPVRKVGLDNSIHHAYGCYGASTVPEILNVSPYRSNVDTYENMRGKPSKKDPDKEEIFFAGHKIEPVYRDYFQHMYGHKYLVFNCDIRATRF